jgi:hypothetical protein
MSGVTIGAGAGGQWFRRSSRFRGFCDISRAGRDQGMAENGERAKRGGDRKSKSRGVTLKLDGLGITKMQSSRAKPCPVIAERTGAADRARIGSGGVLRSCVLVSSVALHIMWRR